MRTIETSIEVDAPPSAVWATLADLRSYPEWNPHVVAATGDLREGERLAITVRREGEADVEMTVRVTAVDPERRLAWVGTWGTRFLFRGEHAVELDPLDRDRTRVVNRERVSGLLAGLAQSEDPEADYAAMNRALKEQVEAAVPDPAA